MNRRHPDIIDDASSKEPDAITVRRVNVSPDNPNVIVQGPFYKVSTDMRRLPIFDHLDHGYESKRDFFNSVEALVAKWGGREGECVEEACFHGKSGEAIDKRHRQLRLRFYDTLSRKPDEAWLPLYMLDPCPVPEYARRHEPTPRETLMGEIYSTLWTGSSHDENDCPERS